jgi:hypothetical protein
MATVLIKSSSSGGMCMNRWSREFSPIRFWWLLISVAWPLSAQQCMSSKAAELVTLLDKAVTEMRGGVPERGGSHPGWGAHCSQYLRAVLRQLPASSGVDARWISEGDDSWTAEQFFRSLPNDSRWHAVDVRAAQQLANRGSLVIGMSPAHEGHAHVGVVYPVPTNFNWAQFTDGSGPFVRDGNEHTSYSAQEQSNRLYPSTYGAVRASKAFSLQSTQWYSFTGRDPEPEDSVKSVMMSSSACQPPVPPNCRYAVNYADNVLKACLGICLRTDAACRSNCNSNYAKNKAWEQRELSKCVMQ